MIPSLFPYFDNSTDQLYDGATIQTCHFCKRRFAKSPECRQHYASLLTKTEGYYECPFGFTSRNLYFLGNLIVITGIIAFPRFNTQNERARAKDAPQNKVSRELVECFRALFHNIETCRADAIDEAAQVFPQSFHELRKLNAAILQHAEKEMRDTRETPGLLSIRSAAELMRNNFDILEALSNLDGMKALPTDATINLFDLIYKIKRIFNEKASARKLSISVDGVSPIIRGSQKSFPIVPAVLLENAIKYGRQHSVIRATISVEGSKAIITFENETDHPIDSVNCFNRGSRYAGNSVEGGGYGLYLAREIVRAHHGEIRCEIDDKLVRMIIELPLKEVMQKKNSTPTIK